MAFNGREFAGNKKMDRIIMFVKVLYGPKGLSAPDPVYGHLFFLKSSSPLNSLG